MCLDTITERYERPSRRVVWAWKCFAMGLSKEQLLFEFSDLNGKFVVQRGEWLKAEEKTIGENGWPYTSGFHAFKHKDDAEGWWAGGALTVVKVKLRGVHTIGTQGPDMLVLVASELYVPKPRKGEK